MAGFASAALQVLQMATTTRARACAHVSVGRNSANLLKYLHASLTTPMPELEVHAEGDREKEW